MRRVFPIAVVFAIAVPAFAATTVREGAAVFVVPAGWTRVSDGEGTRYVSPDKKASFTFGHAAPFEGALEKVMEGQMEAAKTLPHVMIVSDHKTPDGRPLVIHNIGGGAREEDALATYPLTGHYRWK